MRASPHAHPGPARREPSRLLFALGALLGVVSVLPFPLRTAGGGSLGLFHAVSQTLGFLTCFALGFLFHAVPRITRTRGPDGWDLAAAVAAPPLMVLSAWGNAPALPYLLWIAVVAVAIQFTVARLRLAPRRDVPAAARIWVPLSLAAGVLGALLAASAPLLAGTPAPRAWTLGRGLLSQGLCAGLVLGLAGTVARRWRLGAPGDTPAGADPSSRRGLVVHVVAALLFFASFPVEVLVHVRAGLALRAAVATGVLATSGLGRPGAVPGAGARLTWIGAWLVPLGLWLAALLPRQRAAALHVVFVGGFAVLALAASARLAVEAGGVPGGRAWARGALGAMAALLGAASAARLAAAYDVRRVAWWLSVAALCFTGAVVAWAIALPATARPAPRPSSSSSR